MLLFFEVITMIFVGIDVAKDTHYAAVSDDSGAGVVMTSASGTVHALPYSTLVQHVSV